MSKQQNINPKPDNTVKGTPAPKVNSGDIQFDQFVQTVLKTIVKEVKK